MSYIVGARRKGQRAHPPACYFVPTLLPAERLLKKQRVLEVRPQPNKPQIDFSEVLTDSRQFVRDPQSLSTNAGTSSLCIHRKTIACRLVTPTFQCES